MGLATAVTWFWNAVNAVRFVMTSVVAERNADHVRFRQLFFPLQIRSWTSAGAFYWFGGWK